MAIFKCKMCGGDLEVVEGKTVAECAYCGTQQTIPSADDEKRVNLFNRANRLRIKNEFDKAEGIYESIISEFPEEAEAYWGICLCRYGIEYVDDPATAKKIPTCHRTSFGSIFDDENYKQAIENADVVAQKIYRDEARIIDNLQKDILSVVSTAEPYDVFICYKETGENGQRTHDSVMAQDIYDALTEKGLRVFFARISLEDKLGTAYEPYIFAALNSAKVMLVVGTKYEHFNAVWVKNEWARYIGFMKTDKKRVLIPCFKDMDAYDLPEEFAHLQAQDMGKIGAIQDLVRGIMKIISDNKAETVVKETTIISGNTSTEPLLKRATLFLEDGNWQEADQYCERVLDLDPENAQAYLYKLMAKLRVRTKESLRDLREPFDNEDNYHKTLRFADKALAEELEEAIAYIKEKKEEARKESIYSYALSFMKKANDEKTFKSMARDFGSISGYKDSDSLKKQCEEKAEECRQRAEEIIAEKKRIEEEKRIAAEKRKKKAVRISIITAISAVVCTAIALVTVFVIIPNVKYNIAMTDVENKNFDEAIAIFTELGDFSDSTEKIKETKYRKAEILFSEQKYYEALTIFTELGDFKDAKEQHDKIILKLNNKSMLNCGSISTGFFHTVAVNTKGKVATVGENYTGQCNVSRWVDIVSVSAGTNHSVGLKSDGTVVAVGENDYYGQCDVSGWTDIIAVSAGYNHTVGLKSDGTVVAIGENYNGQCNVSRWVDIVSVSAGTNHSVGLKSDGTVVAVGENDYGRCDVSGWTDIIAVSAGGSHTIGLKADGTVVATGDNVDGRCDVSGWTDIIAVSAGSCHTVGVKSDGTVVATGFKGDGRCDVSGWTDIIAVSAGNSCTVGLKSDGTVVAVGNNSYGQCNVSDWKDIAVKTE